MSGCFCLSRWAWRFACTGVTRRRHRVRRPWFGYVLLLALLGLMIFRFSGYNADLSGTGQVAAAPDFVGAGENARDGFGVSLMLFDEDAGGEGFGGVGVEDGDASLQDDDAVVYGFIDEVDGAAGDLCAEVEGLGLGFKAGEGG